MSTHYFANHGHVIPFDEETAEKLDCLEEYNCLKEEDELNLLTELGWSEKLENDSENGLVKARHKIFEAINAVIPKGKWEIIIEQNIVEPGEVVTESECFIYVYSNALLRPTLLCYRLTEKFNLTEDWWVTWG